MSRLVNQFWQTNGRAFLHPPSPRAQAPHPGTPGQSHGLLGWLRETFGGWLGPRLSPGTPAGDYVGREKMASGPRRVVVPWFLPYHDDQTRETPAMRLAYRWMLSDATVKSAVTGQIRAVASLKPKVRPANKSIAKYRRTAAFVEWDLAERLADGIPGLVWSVLVGGLVDGHSVCEKVWDREEKGRYKDKWPLTRLKPKDVNNDLVLQTDEYRNVTGLMGLRYNGGTEFTPADYLIYRHLPLFDAPTGQSALRAAYQPWWMLDTVRKFRAVNAEKRAMPFAAGTWTTPDQQQMLNSALAQVKSQNWVSVPDGVKLDIIDMAGSADDIYDSFCKYLKHEIFLGIADASLQAIEGTITDGRGNSQVHDSRADEAVKYLAATVVAVLNDRERGLVRDIVDLNEVVDEYPRVSLEGVDTDELKKQAELDKVLIDTGMKLSLEDAYERYERVPPKGPGDVWGKQEAPPGGAPGGAPPASPFSERVERFCQEGPNKGKPGVCPEGGAEAPAAGESANRPSLPEERDPEKVKSGPPSLPFRRPPAPRGAKGGGKAARPTGEESNTHFGDRVEEVTSAFQLRTILPPGQRAHRPGEVAEKGSTIDREWDHSGYAFEVKACRTTASEYKAKPKKSEVEGKLKFAELHGLKPAVMIPVVDMETGEVHVYWREGIGAYRLDPEKAEAQGWHYMGSAKIGGAG